MARPRIIDPVELHRLKYQEHKSQRECAKIFGVSEAAVSKALQEVKAGTTKVVALEAGHKVVTAQLDVLGQLGKINQDAIEILDLMMKWQRGDKGALRILQSQVRKVKIGRGENAREVMRYKFKDPRDLALKAMGEIREQLRLQVDIAKTLYDVKEMASFQGIVVETVGNANKCPRCTKEFNIVCDNCGEKIDLRRVITEELKRARALRSGVQFRV